MYCSSCGAPLNGEEEKCPYCGSYILQNAERAYMEHLETIREDTEDLKDVAKDTYKTELKRHGHFVLKTIVIIVCIIVVFSLIAALRYRISKNNENSRIRAELKFKEEYFPRFNALHDAGDYDTVCDYINKSDLLEGSSILSSWEHMAFYDYYIHYQELCDFRQAYEEDLVDDYQLYVGFYDAIYLYHSNNRASYEPDLPEKDEQQVTLYREEAMIVLKEVFDLTGTELENVYQSCLEYNYPSYKLCTDYLKTNIDSY